MSLKINSNISSLHATEKGSSAYVFGTYEGSTCSIGAMFAIAFVLDSQGEEPPDFLMQTYIFLTFKSFLILDRSEIGQTSISHRGIV